jgi:hypothetical protein
MKLRCGGRQGVSTKHTDGLGKQFVDFVDPLHFLLSTARYPLSLVADYIARSMTRIFYAEEIRVSLSGAGATTKAFRPLERNVFTNVRSRFGVSITCIYDCKRTNESCFNFYIERRIMTTAVQRS